MAGFDMNDKKKTAGVCIYFCVAIFSLSAFCCGIAATGYCGFVSRDIQIKSDRTEFCDSLQMETEVCATLLNNHGVGFFGWQADVPVDQTACFSYTQYVPGVGYVTPPMDTKFNTARASSYVADIFGAIGFFTVWICACCPISQTRIKWLAFCFFIATLFQGLTLLIFKSNVCKPFFFQDYFPLLSEEGAALGIDSLTVSCGLATGSKLALSATVLYLVCIFAIFKAIPPIPSWEDDDREDRLVHAKEPAAMEEEEDAAKKETAEEEDPAKNAAAMEEGDSQEVIA